MSGNRAGALLAKQAKRKAAASKIPYMHTAEENRVSNPTDIANCFRDFYSSLYNLNTSIAAPNPEPTQVSNFLDSLRLPTLTLTN